jgi:UDP-GlcNAc3NAcA epimerase
MKIITIVGNRPQFVKAAAVCRAIEYWNEQKSDKITHKIIHTGQHFDENMSDIFFLEMELPQPKYYLRIGGCSQGAMTGRMIEKTEEILIKEKPDWVLVFGDTNSTLAGALAAVKLHISIGHVEAGLRSFNKKMPEEINRIVTDHCAELLFTPTKNATIQLLKEGILEKKIQHTGDVMHDVFLHYQEKAIKQSLIIEQLNLQPKNYVLASVHRAENTDNSHTLKEIILGLCTIAKFRSVVFPIHPRTKKVLQEQNLLDRVKKELLLLEPIGYFDMLRLESNAEVILTDSGGVQKEAYFSRTPCITLRNETEWTELIDHGFNKLVPLREEAIFESYQKTIAESPNWNKTLYGAGDSARQIIALLANPTRTLKKLND